MKQILPYTFLLFAATACKKDFIELTPVTTPSADNFYKTGADMVNAINATYAILQSGAAASNEFLFGDVTTDDAQSITTLCAQGHCDFDFYLSNATTSSSIGQIQARWNDSYRGIYRANTVLNRIVTVQMDEPLKNRLIAEAKFLRAYYYFNLTKIFGDVPLVLQELTSPNEAYTYSRESAATVFAQIQKDLSEAITSLPPSYAAADVGRATSGAAKAILARVLLFNGKQPEALPYLKDIVDNQSPATYDLLPNYADVFKQATNNNKEILFAVQYTPNSIATGEGNPVTGSFVPVSGTTIPVAGTGANQPTTDIYNAYQPTDKRRDINIGSTVVGGVTNYYVNKFVNSTVTSAAENGTDYPIIRFADVLLMYAECLNETSTIAAALPYINKVRSRAGLPDLQTTNAAVTDTYVSSKENLRDRIAKERRLELAFEGLRFFDLVRTNKLVPVMNAFFTTYNIKVNGATLQISDYQKLFPVPQAQIDINPDKIKQNTGYF